MALALLTTAATSTNAAEITGWGDFKLFLDPGHAGHENSGLYGYTEAEKVLRVAWSIRDNLKQYTDIPEDCIKLCRETDADYLDLDERSDMANAWGADFYYSIHSDASGSSNTTLFLFGGWYENGVGVEKTPNGGKKFGDILNPNLTGVMKIGTRGNWYDRYFYDRVEDHDNSYPYLSVNRRTTMASLLSEGGYHTLAEQQQKNLNDSYKKLEGYAAFRSILEFRGLSNPVQTILTGVITNSENNVPINGVKVSVGGQSVVTDTYESLFNKYTNNQNLIHNGFYMFENLEAGKEYEVTFESEEFGTTTQKVTIVSDPKAAAADNITWLDIQMISKAPAKVAATSIEDPLKVNLLDDILITFSRNMDKASVEKAFSINNKGEVTLSWDNEYTLRVNISKLMEEFDYIITIDGSIAKNTQTNQFFDGDGDGKEGGNYTLSFVTLPPDVDAPKIVSISPEENSTVKYTYRPVIRVEYDELINWNDDKQSNVITVVDKDKKVYEGVLKHDVVGKRSVVHFYFTEDLPADKCFLVNISGGLPDLSGNTSEGKEFKFLSEFRPTLSSTVIDPLESISGWFQPHGSGSSDGWTTEAENTMEVVNKTSSLSRTSCFEQKYAFDTDYIGGAWTLRCYRKLVVSEVKSDIDGVLQVYLYGDGSNNGFGFGVRANKAGGGVKVQNSTPIDFCGWKLMSWKMNDGNYWHLSGEGVDQLTAKWWFDDFFISHKRVEEGDEDADGNQLPIQAWNGTLRYDDVRYVKYDETATQTASLEDITSGAEEIVANNISIVTLAGNIHIASNNGIDSVVIFNAMGETVYSSTPNSNVANIATDNISNGIYIIKVKSANNQETKKIIL